MSEESKEIFDPNAARNQAGDVLVKMAVTKITDEDAWYQWREWRRFAKLTDKVAKAHYDQIKKPMNDAIKNIRDMENKDREPLEKILEMADPSIIAFEEQLEIERDKKQRELETQAMAKAQAQRDAKVAELEHRGKQAQADALRASPLSIPPIVLPPVFQPLPGEGRKVTWGVSEAEADIDILELARAVLNGQLPPTVLAPEFTNLNKMAHAIKGSGKIPGCKIVPHVSITQR